MSSAAPRIHTRNWLLEHGPRELEQLFRAVVYRPDAARIPALGEQDALALRRSPIVTGLGRSLVVFDLTR